MMQTVWVDGRQGLMMHDEAMARLGFQNGQRITSAEMWECIAVNAAVAGELIAEAAAKGGNRDLQRRAEELTDHALAKLAGVSRAGDGAAALKAGARSA